MKSFEFTPLSLAQFVGTYEVDITGTSRDANFNFLIYRKF